MEIIHWVRKYDRLTTEVIKVSGWIWYHNGELVCLDENNLPHSIKPIDIVGIYRV